MLLLRREPSNDGDKCVMAVLNDQCLQWFTPQEQHLTREKGLTGAKDPVFMDSMAQSPTLISKLVATG